MKLRIRGNLLRFRLSRSEVQAFGKTGKIEENVNFGQGKSDFSYALETSAEDTFSGSFADGQIAVRVPASIVMQWVESDDVGIEGTQTLDETTKLSFLIEKDFDCLNAHNDEDQSDRYPHPNADASC